MKPEDLPENMRNMTLQEQTAFVEKMQNERGAIQKKINDLNAQRVKFVSEKRKELAQQSGDDTLDRALIGAIHDQATKKDFSFGK